MRGLRSEMTVKKKAGQSESKTTRTLAHRFAELEDKEAIATLICQMNWLADENRLDELLDCFVDDLFYDVGKFGTYRGKAALRAFYEQTVGPFSMRIHRTTNQVIELQGARAKARCYWRADLVMQGRALISSGHYYDELLKLHGHWKVQVRRATITYMCPLEDGWAKTRMMSLE